MKLLQEYYEAYLKPFKFVYKLSDGNIIDLRFNKKSFPHLVGTETIAKKKYKNDSMLRRYRGEWGYRRIKKEELNFTELKNISSSGFKSIKDKLLFFYQIPHIILSPEAIFRYKKVNGSNIECEILIYDLMHGVCSHLGIEKDDSGQFYVPRTFLIERNNGLKFVQDQDDEIVVDKIEQVELSNNTVICSIDLESLRGAGAPATELETEIKDKS